MREKNVLSIAGSDPSGGAGIQADLKTFTTLGVYGTAVVTCVTAQNTQQFSEIHFVKANMMKAQIKAVLEDINISFIKVGMVGNASIAKTIGEMVEGYKVIFDPVMVSKTGRPLMKKRAGKAVEKWILPKTFLLTPNFPELQSLSGKDIKTAIEAAEAVMQKFSNLEALLVKGGHIEEDKNEITDTLLIRTKSGFERHIFTHPRFAVKSTHGTGCTLSSAITAFLARGKPLPEAVESAIKYLTDLIQITSKEPSVGKGNGALLHYLMK
jgi:hydroxymethylpyrimidine/phosphomethylpyrimidine kinase